VFRYWLAGQSQEVGRIDFDPSAHAWWRLRETSGTTYYETSADGHAFSVQGSVATPIGVDATHIAFFGGTEPSSESPGEMRFTDLNLAP
jgi:hypothetical protein